MNGWLLRFRGRTARARRLRTIVGCIMLTLGLAMCQYGLSRPLPCQPASLQDMLPERVPSPEIAHP